MSMPRQALSNQNHNQMSRQAFITNHHHHHHHHLLHVLLFTLLVPISFAANDEVSALISWMHSSSNTVPLAFSSWNPLDSNPCNWSYIKCSSASLVTEITIQNVELALPFPSKISSFPFLQKLVISGANLTGVISIDIGICLELVVLDLSSNSLVGGIPSSIGRLRNLQRLFPN